MFTNSRHCCKFMCQNDFKKKTYRLLDPSKFKKAALNNETEGEDILNSDSDDYYFEKKIY